MASLRSLYRGVSKAAILYRGRQLGAFSEDQARAGYIGLTRHGEAVQESEDHMIEREDPELVSEGLEVMKTHFGVPKAAVARAMWVQPNFLQGLLGDHPNKAEPSADILRLALG
jgi:hypothetical protein